MFLKLSVAWINMHISTLLTEATSHFLKKFLNLWLFYVASPTKPQRTYIRWRRQINISFVFMLIVGSVCDGQCGTPPRMSAAGDLSHLNGAAHNPADAVRLPARLRQRKQGQHWLAAPAQLVCADSKGMKENIGFLIYIFGGECSAWFLLILCLFSVLFNLKILLTGYLSNLILTSLFYDFS